MPSAATRGTAPSLGLHRHHDVRRLDDGGDLAALADAELVHGLDRDGCDEALSAAVELAAERVRAPGLDVAVESAGLPDVGPAAEAAAYRIATEALANVVRHSGARSVRVALVVDDAHLEVSVADDGVGLPTPRRRGVGLTSMQSRAEELGGTLTLSTPPDGRGTVVRALLPIPEVSS